MDNSDIGNVRERIDSIDAKILSLLNERASVATEAGKLKKGNGMTIFDPARENIVLESVLKGNAGPLSDASLGLIFREIISACRTLQEPFRVAFLGPETTYTHMAAVDRFGGSVGYAPQPTIPDVFLEVERKGSRFGVVPVENSIEGSVNVTFDQLNKTDASVCGEIILGISHVLMSKTSDVSEIKRVFSHPQALSQCRNWLRRNLPGAALVETGSTAAAARTIVDHPDGAAIGSAMTAEQSGLHILASDIQDTRNNYTRFLVIGYEPPARTGRDKTSVLFVTRHTPGSLYNALLPLAEKGINLHRIESRPISDRPWEYVFFVDFEGHVEDDMIKDALSRLGKNTQRLKVLGSFPMGKQAAKGALFSVSEDDVSWEKSHMSREQ